MSDDIGCPLSQDLPERAWLVALMSLPGLGPRRLAQLADQGDAPSVWAMIRRGELPVDIGSASRSDLFDAAAVVDIGELWQRHVDADISVLLPGDQDYPSRLIDDPEPPAALFARGDVTAGTAPTVAIVGTRRCTVYGRSIATELGRNLTELGISVVSGLALGIDAAAHAGAVSAASAAGAAPIAVVAAGLDRPAPQANLGLFKRITSAGLVVSEAPLGVAPVRWRFPARNRIIAGLADAVVVVESAVQGGSLYTVDEALRRDRPVLAVPGSIRSPLSRGTNQLIVDGATPYLDIDDVLNVIGHDPSTSRPTPARSEMSADAQLLLDHLDYETALVDDLIVASRLTVGRAIAALDELLRLGAVARQGAVVQRIRSG